MDEGSFVRAEEKGSCNPCARTNLRQAETGRQIGEKRGTEARDIEKDKEIHDAYPESAELPDRQTQI